MYKYVQVGQLAKRQRMLAYCYQRTGAMPQAVESSARAAALLAISSDCAASAAAVQEW